MKRILKPLIALHYGAYFLAIIIASFGMKIISALGWSIDPLSSSGVSLSSILIVFIVGSVPLSLWLFHKQMLKLMENENLKSKIKIYSQLSTIRLLVLGAALNFGILFFYIFQMNKSLLFCAGIAAIGMVFSKPSELRLITDLQLTDEDIDNLI